MAARRSGGSRGRGQRSPASFDARSAGRLCAQVRRAVDFALMECAGDGSLLERVRVDAVDPAVAGQEGPTVARLVVRFAFDAEGLDPRPPRDTVQLHLEAARGAILEEVARSIARRRVPDLDFEVVLAAGGSGPSERGADDGEDPASHGDGGSGA